jgi:hypothetical protein
LQRFFAIKGIMFLFAQKDEIICRMLFFEGPIEKPNPRPSNSSFVSVR